RIVVPPIFAAALQPQPQGPPEAAADAVSRVPRSTPGARRHLASTGSGLACRRRSGSPSSPRGSSLVGRDTGFVPVITTKTLSYYCPNIIQRNFRGARENHRSRRCSRAGHACYHGGSLDGRHPHMTEPQPSMDEPRLPGARAGTFVARWVTPCEPGQIQPNGVDLRGERLFRVTGPGRLDPTGTVPGPREEVPWSQAEPLAPGAYVVRYRERITIPPGELGQVFPRSSLRRNCAVLFSAWWDHEHGG